MTTHIDLDLAIIGAGLCGLALARSLHGQDLNWAVFEARPRLGGRILTESGPGGAAVDLGPTWFWPDTEPLMAGLVAELGLPDFPQHDTGQVLRLADTSEGPETLTMPGIHGGARRLAGGMVSLVQALAQALTPSSLHLNSVLRAVEDGGDHVILTLDQAEDQIELRARQVVLALPPRLALQYIQFQPPLPTHLIEAMAATHTWMADQAKAVMVFERPFWREAGHSGNAFVSHEQALLKEVFDACDATGQQAALGGFFALSAADRQAFAEGLPMLVSSQFMQLFGPEAESGRQYVQDWSRESWTCATADLAPAEAPEYGHPVLRQTYWDGRLLLGGSETGAYGGGHLEGALEAAARLGRLVLRRKALAAVPNTVESREACLGRFRLTVSHLRQTAFERYRQHLVRDLAEQRREQLTQRAVLAALEQVYAAALAAVAELPLQSSGLPVEKGRCALTPEFLAPFEGFVRELMDQALAFNRTSCALSNFPSEAQPEREYRETMVKDLAAAWVEFALAVNVLLLSKV